jgi:predicted amidophosphoribosyltransferase
MSTVVMHRLNKEQRSEAGNGLFVCHWALDPESLYVLVDDVYTTGATLHAARTALLAAGARHVQAIVLARQPLD